MKSKDKKLLEDIKEDFDELCDLIDMNIEDLKRIKKKAKLLKAEVLHIMRGKK